MKPTRYIKFFAALGALGLSLATAHGQGFGTPSNTDMNVNGTDGGPGFSISVKAGKAKYVQTSAAGGGSALLGDGTLLDWQIHTAVNGESPFEGNTVSSGPGTYFDTATCADSFVGGPQNYFDVWDANDIDTQAADIPSGTTPAVGNGPTPIGGNINISGLTAGQIYVVSGSYRSSPRVNLTMTGPGKTPISISYALGNPGSVNRMRLYELPFTNPGGEYTNIEWNASNNQNNTGRRRWGGIFLDGTIFVDTVPPNWVATYPNINPVASTSLGINGQTDEATTIHYVVLADGAPAPTSAQVKAGTDGSAAAALASGNYAVAGLEEGSELVTGLTASTAYDVYVVAEDVRGPNLQAAPVMFDVTTPAPDTTPPVWTATYPQVSRTPASVTGIANIDEFGNAYFVVLPSGATPPSSAQVKAGTDASNAAAPSGSMLGLSSGVEGSAGVGGLTVGTAYDVYFVAEDLEGNLQVAPQMVSSAPAAAVNQFATGGQAWGTDSVWSSATGGPYTNPWGDGNNAVFEGGSSLVAVDPGTTVGDITFNSNNWLLNGGPLNLSGATTPTITVNGNVADFENVISGTQGLIKEGNGTIQFNSNNTTNTITGGWALNGGNLGDNGGNLGVSELNGNDITTNGGSNVGITFRAGTFTSNFTLNAPFTRMSNNNSTVTITGAVTGNGGIELNKTGNGFNGLNLTSTSNTFTGGVNYTSNRDIDLNVNSFADSAVPGTGNIVLGNGNPQTVRNRFALTGGAIAPLTLTNRQFELAGAETTWRAEIRNESSQAFTINSDLLVSGTNTKDLRLGGNGAGTNTFAGAIGDSVDDSLSLTKEGSGSWILSGTNTYTGDTSIVDGALEIGGAGQLGSGTYAGNISIGNDDQLIVNSSADQTLSGIISDTSNNGTLTKDNSGTLFLNGVNTYNGLTTVNGGALGGTGTVAGNVLVNTNGGLAPGASAGTLTISGDLDISGQAGGAGTLDFELDALAATSDRIVVGGTLTIGSGDLGISDFTFADLGGLETGIYTLISAGSISGSLDAGDASGFIGNVHYDLAIDGNDLVVLVRPPTTVVITRKDPNPSMFATVRWDVTFADPVEGLIASNFSLTGDLAGSSTINTVSDSGSGTDWVVTATTTGSCGFLGLNLINDSGLIPRISPPLPSIGEVYGIDTVAPMIECAKDIVVSIPAGDTTDPIAYETTASDACSGLASLEFSTPTGSQFEVGVHPITATATDNAGNEATATFNVVVLAIAETPGGRFIDASVVSGDAASGDDVPAGAEFQNIYSAYLNNGGGVLFSASLTGGSAGVFSGASTTGPFSAIAVKGVDTGPGAFGTFSDLALNDSGETGFVSRLPSGLAHFVGASDSAVQGGVATATGGGEIYRSLQKPALASTGVLLTRANLVVGSGAGVTVFDDTVITGSDGSLLAREGDATSIGAGVFYSGLNNRVVASEDNNYYAFSSNLKPGSSKTNSAVFADVVGAGSPAVFVREGDAAPGTGGGVFDTFLGEAVNGNGDVALRGTARGTGITADNREAIWTDSGGALAQVAREGDDIPCLPAPLAGLVAFDRFETLAIADDGSVCFFAYLRNASGPGPVNSTNDGSIWRWEDGELHLIAREGDAANNTAGAVIGRLDAFACSGTGGVVYQVEYVANQGDTTSANRDGIYLDRGVGDAAPELVLRRGDSFEFEGESRTVGGLAISTEENPGGGTGGYGRAINDAGDILLNLSISGNYSGLFVLSSTDED